VLGQLGQISGKYGGAVSHSSGCRRSSRGARDVASRPPASDSCYRSLRCIETPRLHLNQPHDESDGWAALGTLGPITHGSSQRGCRQRRSHQLGLRHCWQQQQCQQRRWQQYRW
jgi:hypothetical protein